MFNYLQSTETLLLLLLIPATIVLCAIVAGINNNNASWPRFTRPIEGYRTLHCL